MTTTFRDSKWDDAMTGLAGVAELVKVDSVVDTNIENTIVLIDRSTYKVNRHLEHTWDAGYCPFWVDKVHPKTNKVYQDHLRGGSSDLQNALSNPIGLYVDKDNLKKLQ